jgi:homoserine dehydrogenase
MSTVVQLAPSRRRAPRLALLGTGVVGTAFVGRYARLRGQLEHLPDFTWLANSRSLQSCDTDLAVALEQARQAPAKTSVLPPWAEAESLHVGDVVVDATGSETVADWHAEWLSRGIHVVTANKLGNGGALVRAQAIQQARRHGGSHYGDSATVGAGLPLLRSLRALVAGGDRIHRVEGILSGSLAWLFNHYDGTRAFSALVRQARDAGYTEPDPRDDLSGQDVQRKLLILARAAGIDLHAEQVQVASLVPAELAALSTSEFDARLEALDAPLAQRWQQATQAGAKLRFVGRFDGQGASVGVQALPDTHPFCAGGGTDNRVAIYSDRYADQPLVVQGPGAGAEVTAAALLDDVLNIVR